MHAKKMIKNIIQPVRLPLSQQLFDPSLQPQSAWTVETSNDANKQAMNTERKKLIFNYINSELVLN